MFIVMGWVNVAPGVVVQVVMLPLSQAQLDITTSMEASSRPVPPN
ncbi:hypothetical protein ACGFNV_33905 [Streptomyces sp. NPDC048751]